MPQDALVQLPAWPMGGAVWLINKAMYHFRFTQDKAFARDVPLQLEWGAIEFVYDFAVLEGGYYYIYPSSSLESSYDIPRGDKTEARSRDEQMDRALLHNLFSSFMTERLLGWEEDVTEAKAGHRHFCSIYGLYPGRQYSPLVGNKTVFDAAHEPLE